MSSSARRERVDVVGRSSARAASPRAAVEAVDDVVGDPVALLLAEQEVAGELGALGILGQQVAQQRGARCTLRPDSSKQVEQLGVRRRANRAIGRRP